MENREIVIVSEGGRILATLNSSVETLGDLKNELRIRNISYEGVEFIEGYSKSKLMDDSAPLPRNIKTRTGITNNLMFMLTVPNKKIKSGILDRKKMYEIIKENNLYDSIFARFGINYTRCSNVMLYSFIMENTYIDPEDCIKETKDNIDIMAGTTINTKELTECIDTVVEKLMTLKRIISSKGDSEYKETFEVDKVFEFLNRR